MAWPPNRSHFGGPCARVRSLMRDQNKRTSYIRAFPLSGGIRTEAP
ncbi:hypothetical protein NB311A_14055 [Nitrobacter sp. Nb-311A]|nr:hypothetical protein NB311A_14055 [Nitrobacter sp. Nb-311A]